MFVHVKARYVS